MNPIPYHWQYLPILLQVMVAFGLGAAMVAASWFVGRHRNTTVKLAAYVCGIEAVGDARGRFSVRFYMVAMLFILFDVEAVFLYPWAIILKDLKRMGQGVFGISEMFVYIGIVLVGFFYIWKKGVLDWGLTVTHQPRATRSQQTASTPDSAEAALVGASGRGGL
jgi:NADH-quinone oxidoreductase subunit A